MSMVTSAAANLVWITALLLYLAFAVYGLYVQDKLRRLRCTSQPISRENRWNQSLYRPEAAKWLARARLWQRLELVVWIGLPAAAGLLNVLLWR